MSRTSKNKSRKNKSYCVVQEDASVKRFVPPGKPQISPNSKNEEIENKED